MFSKVWIYLAPYITVEDFKIKVGERELKLELELELETEWVRESSRESESEKENSTVRVIES